MFKRLALLAFCLFLHLSPCFLFAQGAPPGKTPPAAVVVSDVSAGFVAPEAEFVGTVFYLEVSEVAAEVNGRIEEVNFEEGHRIKAGKVRVTLHAAPPREPP